MAIPRRVIFPMDYGFHARTRGVSPICSVIFQGYRRGGGTPTRGGSPFVGGHFCSDSCGVLGMFPLVDGCVPVEDYSLVRDVRESEHLDLSFPSEHLLVPLLPGSVSCFGDRLSDCIGIRLGCCFLVVRTCGPCLIMILLRVILGCGVVLTNNYDTRGGFGNLSVGVDERRAGC